MQLLVPIGDRHGALGLVETDRTHRMVTEVVLLTTEVEVRQEPHVDLQHHRFTRRQALQQRLLRRGVAARLSRPHRHAGALARQRDGAPLRLAPPTEERRHALEAEVPRPDPLTQAQQHVLRNHAAVETVDVQHRPRHAVVGRPVLKPLDDVHPRPPHTSPCTRVAPGSAAPNRAPPRSSNARARTSPRHVRARPAPPCHGSRPALRPTTPQDPDTFSTFETVWVDDESRPATRAQRQVAIDEQDYSTTSDAHLPVTRGSGQRTHCMVLSSRACRHHLSSLGSAYCATKLTRPRRPALERPQGRDRVPWIGVTL